MNTYNSKRSPLMIVNIYVNSNQKVQLPIYKEKPFKWAVRQLAQNYHLKQNAVPFIKNLITYQMKKHKLSILQFDKKQQQVISIIDSHKTSKNFLQKRQKNKQSTKIIKSNSNHKNMIKANTKHTSSMYIHQPAYYQRQYIESLRDQNKRLKTSRSNEMISSFKNNDNFENFNKNATKNQNNFNKKNEKSNCLPKKSKNNKTSCAIKKTEVKKEISKDFLKKQSKKIKPLNLKKAHTLAQTDISTIEIASRLSEQKEYFSISMDQNQQLSMMPTTMSNKIKSKTSSLFQITSEKGEDQISQYVENDLQNKMHYQIKKVQIQKLIKTHQKAILLLYQKLIKNNPPSIRRIHADYITFEFIPQNQLICLQNLFQKMDHLQLNQLSYKNFLTLIGKYQADDLIFSLTKSQKDKK